MMRETKKERAERQAREVEAGQKGLRASIAETERLVGQSEELLRRHRREREEHDD